MKVLLAMSGGIDSSVAALVLQREGYEVTGVFMRNGVVKTESTQKSCCSVGDAYDARRIADRLGIPFYAVNFADGFEKIIENFVSEYQAGRTPNPCVLCNRDLKFGKLLDYADALGIDRVATGHYARIEEQNGRHALLRSGDENKDQTYMLFPLSQEQLSRTLFPLGTTNKPHVRELARGAGFSISEKAESQEICFVPDNEYRNLLRARTAETFRAGSFVSPDGEILGTHEGHVNFTIGQRKGIGAFGRKMYVVDIRPDSNTVVLDEREGLLKNRMTIGRMNWVSIARPEGEFRANVKIRHGNVEHPCRVRADGDKAFVRFDKPAGIITPGQAAVLYEGDLVLGGGWIESAA